MPPKKKKKSPKKGKAKKAKPLPGSAADIAADMNALKMEVATHANAAYQANEARTRVQERKLCGPL